MLNFSLGDKWVVGNTQDIKNKAFIIDFIHAGDDITDWLAGWLAGWLELVSIKNFRIPKAYSLNKGFEAFKQQIEKTCPKVTTWHVIEKNANSMVYEWNTRSCQEIHTQYGVGKTIVGKNNIFQVIYSTREFLISPTKRIKWIKKISAAKIEKQTK